MISINIYEQTERERYTVIYEIEGFVVSDDAYFCSKTETLSFMAVDYTTSSKLCMHVL